MQHLQGGLTNASLEKPQPAPVGIPNNAQRHAVQSQKVQEQGPSQEPIIVSRMKDGKLSLLEGWHRTIEALKAFPKGYNGKVWMFDVK